MIKHLLISTKYPTQCGVVAKLFPRIKAKLYILKGYVKAGVFI